MSNVGTSVTAAQLAQGVAPLDPVETWQNVTKGLVVIKKFSHQGGVRGELIQAGRKFAITSAERRLNQEIAASDELDIFSNGIVQPVNIPENVQERDEIVSSPNHLSEDELAGFFKLHPKTYEKKVYEINNPMTIQYLIDLAESPDVSATVNQLQVLKDRKISLGDGELLHVKPNWTADRTDESSMRPVTAR
mgnify:CR=1 FL=1